VINPAVLLLAEQTSTATACALLGKPRGSHYRDRRPVPLVPAQRAPRASPANALSPAEQDEIIAVLTGPRFCDKSVAQTWATLLDEGVYLASMSTMHRLLRLIGRAGDRRDQAAHPARARPELTATKPGQVWSWDITKLRGPERGVYYDLYVILDIYSRYVVSWTVAAREDADIATELIITSAARVHGGPDSLHADRGTSMASKPVAQLLVDLGVARSHSRPHVSNDNPFSEAQFKTLKYAPAFPGRFGSLETPPRSARRSSATTTTSTGTAASRLHTPPRSTTAPPARSAPNGQQGSTPPTPRTPIDSAADPSRPNSHDAAWINQPSREALIQNN
jgi:putative transposase